MRKLKKECFSIIGNRKSFVTQKRRNKDAIWKIKYLFNKKNIHIENKIKILDLVKQIKKDKDIGINIRNGALLILSSWL